MSDMNRWTIAQSSVDMKRSIFPMKSDHKTTFDSSVLVPIYLQEILPGDTMKMDLSYVCRQSTLLKPVMDNSYLDIYFFFVPWRLVWDHTKEFFGENNSSAWIPSTTYTLPQITFGAVSAKSVADYFGVPTGTYGSGLTINHLPFRSYVKIWNDFFRDENLQTPASLYTGDATVTGSSVVALPDADSTSYVTNAALGGSLCPVNKYHDRITSCLPLPQKGVAVTLPMQGNAPVMAGLSSSLHSMNNSIILGTNTGGYTGKYNLMVNNPSSTSGGLVEASSTSSSSSTFSLTKSNLYADLSQVTAATINDLRFAFQLQKYYERLARGGSRYIEYIRSMYGVTSSDARLQRSEFLGGKHFPLNVGTVFQTSESTANGSKQANEAAYSVTSDNGSYFTKSFEEFGYVIGVCCVRTDHTYQQGLEKLWTRKNVTDIYNPLFANIGEQPVYTYELWCNSLTIVNKAVFGFNEAWSEYRYKENRVSGEFRSNYAQSLDIWHYADNFLTQPSLNSDFIHETKSNINRTLAVTTQNQFIADFYFDCTMARVMPMYSTPGLIDHH